MQIDLDTLSLRELRDLQSRVVRSIATFEDRKKKEALAELEELAREKGYSLAELTGVAAPAKRRGRKPASTTGVAKYANPDDSSQTWTGRGRPPRWYTAAVEAGRTPESMTV